MKADYRDIRDRIPEPPLWFDENGVPRYKPFHPEDSPNIYAREVALIEIACQGCRQQFLVELNSSWPLDPLDRKRLDHRLHYGDPPRHGTIGGCAAGDTMNSIPLRVVEFWREDHHDWKRITELEGPMADVGWANA